MAMLAVTSSGFAACGTHTCAATCCSQEAPASELAALPRLGLRGFGGLTQDLAPPGKRDAACAIRPPPGLEALAPRPLSDSSTTATVSTIDPLSPATVELDCLASLDDLAVTSAGEERAQVKDVYKPGSMFRSAASTEPFDLSDAPEARVSSKPVLELASSLMGPVVGSPECPSVGSAGHKHGLCRPCDFVHRNSCRTGAACKFCHLCGPVENRMRKKEKQRFARTLKQWQAAATAAAGGAGSPALPLSRAPAPLTFL